MHADEPLKEVMHTPPLGVLDQSDLVAQGIDVSRFIPGAQSGTDALGSCTANAATAALSCLLPEDEFLHITGASSYQDVKSAEIFAIEFYHACTDLTATPSEEWPPVDCGSSGPYIVQYMQEEGYASGALIAQGAQAIISLLQRGPLLVGQPFLNDWENPAANGMIDGNGSVVTVEQQLRDGVAGGHETLLYGIESLSLSETGQVLANETIIRFRNSWTASWGAGGDYLAHLSTYVALGSNCDYRLLEAVA
jgi:hypothetical protein